MTAARLTLEADPALTPDSTAKLRFERRLSEQSRDRTLAKRERTRCLLLAAIARSLQNEPPNKVTVEAVLDETGLSRGTFYNHFRDLDQAIFVLLQTFLESWLSGRKRSREASGYEAILETNRFYCLSYEENAGLFAAISHFSLTNPELVSLRLKINDDWVIKIVQSIQRRRGHDYAEIDQIALAGTLRILVAMSVATLQERYVNHDTVLCRAYPDHESLAVALSAIWDQVMTAKITMLNNAAP